MKAIPLKDAIKKIREIRTIDDQPGRPKLIFRAEVIMLLERLAVEVEDENLSS